MQKRYIEWLVDPVSRQPLRLGEVREQRGENIIEGSLVCDANGSSFPITRGIPRFVPANNYADSFGLQWEKYGDLRRLAYTDSGYSRKTLLSRMGWTPEQMAGRSLLECGCGSGHDTQTLVDLAGIVVTMDLSNSVDKLHPDLKENPNVLIMQADLMHIPLRHDLFDLVFCHRVLQHTPDPHAAFISMAPFAKPGGEFFLHSYDTHIKSLLQFKYWMRPVTSRLSPHTLLRVLKITGPVLYPITGFLNAIKLKKFAGFLVPFRNHTRVFRRRGIKLTRRQIYDLSLLSTFDGLSPRHDHPRSPRTLTGWFESAGYTQIQVRGRNPVIMTAIRKSA